MSLAKIARAEAGLLVPTYERYKVLFRSGKGVYLYDDHGRRYLDFISGIGVNALGYGHPAVEKALVAQARKLIHISNLFYHDYQAEVAKRLTRISGLECVFFSNSGTEAWETALKLARGYARAHSANGHKPGWRILALEHSFHGRTFASLATTGQPKYRAPFVPLLPGVEFVRFDDVADLKKKFDSSVCAIGVEVVQGEGGLRPVSGEFLRTARSLATKNGALLIADEIQSGLGRTGRWFAYQHFGIRPDIVTVAKPLASGVPLGATLTTRAVARAMHPGLHGSTFGGGPLACAVAVAVLDILEKERMLAHVNRIGTYFRKRLDQLAARHACIREVRGLGLMLGAEVDSPDLAKEAVAWLLKRGFIINRTNQTVLRFLPPFIVERQHVDAMIAALDEALVAVPKRLAQKQNSTRRKK